MPYIDHPCDKCGVILPKNQLAAWEDRVETGRESDTYRRFASGRIGYTRGKVFYRTDRLLLCPACYAVEEDELRNRRSAAHRARAIGLLIAAVIVGALLYALTRPAKPAADSPVPASDAVESGGQSAASDLASAAEIGAANSESASPDAVAASAASVAEPTASSETESAAAANETAQETATEDPLTPSNSGALRAAVSAALRSGQATPWSDGRNAGTVFVGESRVWRGRLCRSFNYSANGVRSGLTLACFFPDGQWRAVQAW